VNNNNFIPVNTPLLKGNEKKYLNECIDSGWISSEGPFVEKFEKAVAKVVNRKYSVAVSSGTAAIDIAISALKIKPGDEIILPTHTIISCISQIIRIGAKPVLVDSCKNSWNMDVNLIEKKITKKTKAIMVVHTYGLPVEMDKILHLSKKYNLYIIEDSAEMIGQYYKDKPCGSFGDISIFSFYPNKHITTGEGGMCLTNNIDIYERCRSYRNLCFQKNKRFVHREIGWNYRITNMQAAIGLAQLENLKLHVNKKREIGNTYFNALKDLKNIQLPLKTTSYADNIYWVFGLVLNDNNKLNAEKVIEILSKNGIGSRPFFYSMHMQPILKKMKIFDNQKYPVSEYLSENGFYIPSGLGISKDEIKNVIEKLIFILK